MEKFSKYIITCLGVFLFFNVGHAQINTNGNISLKQISIIGNSNITGFKLFFNDDRDEINDEVVGVEEADSIVFYIPVEHITAKNRLLLNDFRSLISAREYPYIKLTINEDQLALLNSDISHNKIMVKVTLAGTSKICDIPFYRSCSEVNDAFITGNTNLKLSDFNIDASKKIFGFVRLDDKVFINFKINFSQS